MAYQDPAFYYYHSIREGVAGGGTVTGSPIANSSFDPIFDSRQSELLVFSTDLGTIDKTITTPLEGGALSDAIDTVILSSHNFNGADIRVTAENGGTQTLLAADTITEANGDPVKRTITPPTTGKSDIVLEILSTGAPTDSIVPQLSEIFFTTEHAMTRGPAPQWQHPWRRSQNRFVTEGGVTSTWKTGAARKTFRLTWENVAGADLTVLLNMRTQTADWSFPFWFRPPDDTFPILLVELDQESDWEQVFENPLVAGTGHEITLPLIETLG